MNPDPIADLLSDTLRERTEGREYPSTPMATVTARSRHVRARRRRTTLLAAAAAVALVTVPGAAWLGQSRGSSPEPGGGPSSHSTRPPDRDGPRLTLSSLPQGPAPGIGYVAGDSYVTPDGAQQLPVGVTPAVSIVPVRDGLLVADRRGPNSLTSELRLVQGAHVTDLGCGSSSFAQSADRTEAAYWLASSCDGSGGGRLYAGPIASMGESGTGFVPTSGRDGIVHPIGFLGADVVADTQRDPRVYSSTGTSRRVPGLTDVQGVDESHGLLAGSNRFSPQAHRMVEAATGAVRWVSGWNLGTVSPDGRFVLGFSTERGVDVYALLDATTGRPVTRIHPEGPEAFQTSGFAGPQLLGFAWDGDTLLSNVTYAGQNAIVRSDAEGRTTLATRPVDYPGLRHSGTSLAVPYYALPAP
jgi:hypothetical protein